LLGASGTIPVLGAHRFWTLISASFLHGGIMHILFNMMALYQLGPFVLREFGFHRFINLYIITGACGFAASVFFGVPFTIGASAGICGLIGAIITTVKVAAVLTEKPYINRPWVGLSG